MLPEQPNYFDSEVAGIDHDSLLAAHGVVKDRLDEASLEAIAKVHAQMRAAVDADEM